MKQNAPGYEGGPRLVGLRNVELYSMGVFTGQRKCPVAGKGSRGRGASTWDRALPSRAGAAFRSPPKRERLHAA